jgi:hypothetical protein
MKDSSSSPIAQLLAADPQLYLVAEAYTELQWLHHMAVQQKLQQYGSTAATLPGFVYACLAEVHRKSSSKEPGDSINLHELLRLAGRPADGAMGKAQDMFLQMLGRSVGAEGVSIQSAGSSSSSSPLQLLTEDVLELLASSTVAAVAPDGAQQQQQLLLSDLRLLVLPDLATLLLDSLDPAAAAAGGCLPRTARQGVQSGPPVAAAGQQSSSSSSVSEQLVASLLQQGFHAPALGSTPLLIEQPLDDLLAALGGVRWVAAADSCLVHSPSARVGHCCIGERLMANACCTWFAAHAKTLAR